MQKHNYKADKSVTIAIGLDYGTFHLINVPIQISFADSAFLRQRVASKRVATDRCCARNDDGQDTQHQKRYQ